MSLDLQDTGLNWASPSLRHYLRRRLVDFVTVFAMPRDLEPGVVRRNLAIWGLGAAMATFVSVWIARSDFHINSAKDTRNDK